MSFKLRERTNRQAGEFINSYTFQFLPLLFCPFSSSFHSRFIDSRFISRSINSRFISRFIHFNPKFIHLISRFIFKRFQKTKRKMPALKSSSITRSHRVNVGQTIIVSKNNPISRGPLCEHHYQNINQKIISNGSNQVINRSLINSQLSTVIKLKSIMAVSSGLIQMSSETLRCFVEKELLSQEDSDLKKPLILDCRPFLIYSESHIMGSISVHCPAILRLLFSHFSTFFSFQYFSFVQYFLLFSIFLFNIFQSRKNYTYFVL